MPDNSGAARLGAGHKKPWPGRRNRNGGPDSAKPGRLVKDARTWPVRARDIAHEMKDLDAKQTMLQGIMFVLQ
jgi:hypothetical protein